MNPRPKEERIEWVRSLPFFIVCISPFGLIWTGISSTAIAIFFITYVTRSWCISAGLHRYFAHKSFDCSRAFQFLLALGSAAAAQNGILWWVAWHRHHHKHADLEGDVHSPRHGFWWSFFIWTRCQKHKQTSWGEVREWQKYPELVWLNNNPFLVPFLVGAGCWVIGGWVGVLAFMSSTVFLWGTTFAVNSAGHNNLLGRPFGWRRYNTKDDSTNSYVLAFLTAGEGLHNNHHGDPSSSRFGHTLRQSLVDWGYAGLWFLQKIGVISKLRPLNQRALRHKLAL